MHCTVPCRTVPCRTVKYRTVFDTGKRTYNGKTVTHMAVILAVVCVIIIGMSSRYTKKCWILTDSSHESAACHMKDVQDCTYVLRHTGTQYQILPPLPIIGGYSNLAHRIVWYDMISYHTILCDLILYCISLQRIGEQHPFESNVVDFEQVWGELYRE